MDAMTPQGQALYCNEHVSNAYDFWNSIINVCRPDMDIYIYWGIWYMKWHKVIEQSCREFLGLDFNLTDFYRKKD